MSMITQDLPPDPEQARCRRRGFLGGILAAGLVLGLPASAAAARRIVREKANPDETWLRRLTGRHRQVFDTPSARDGKVLVQVRNFLNAYQDAYGLTDKELSAAIVVHGSAFPLVFDDEVWARFSLGERYAISEAGSASAARRNVFAHARPGDLVPPDASIDALQRRGAVFVLCNNTLSRTSGEIARSLSRPVKEVRDELLRGLLQDVTVVPAAMVALNRAQEQGLSYVYSG